MGALGALFGVAFLSILSCGRAQSCANMDNSDACVWAITTNGKKYSFNLASPIKDHPHGILSEDGFYKVTVKTGAAAELQETTYWFQLCEHMKFNFNPPLCQSCEECGGPDHCGETCSALQASSYPGYSVCTTLGYPGSISYSLIKADKPDYGVRVKMSSCNLNLKPNCSLSILVQCDRSGVKEPDKVTKITTGTCDYEAILMHPAGCPSVTSVSKGGWGWFGSLLFMLILGFVVYMAVGVAYRVSVLRVSGLEAIPNLDTWRTLPSKIQLVVEYLISQCMGIYHRFTEPSYMRANG